MLKFNLKIISFLNFQSFNFPSSIKKEACKPGSVPHLSMASIIYLLRRNVINQPTHCNIVLQQRKRAAPQLQPIWSFNFRGFPTASLPLQS